MKIFNYISSKFKLIILKLLFRSCSFCKKTSSFFCKNHKSCLKQYNDGQKLIISEILNTIENAENLDGLEDTIIKISTSHMIPSQDRKSIIIEGWEKAVERALDKELLDSEEDHRLGELIKYYSLSQTDLDKRGWLTKYSKLAILQEIQKGIIPDIKTKGNIPINLQKNEKIVWAFENSKYLEDKTQRRYVGGSRGISVRVSKGVYYRTGVFRGHTISQTSRVHVDTGWFIVTDKNIYFAGHKKSFRLPYKKIVSFETFSDGLGLVRDAMTAKPQTFITGDGWFTYNLVTSLARI